MLNEFKYNNYVVIIFVVVNICCTVNELRKVLALALMSIFDLGLESWILGVGLLLNALILC